MTKSSGLAAINQSNEIETPHSSIAWIIWMMTAVALALKRHLQRLFAAVAVDGDAGL